MIGWRLQIFYILFIGLIFSQNGMGEDRLAGQKIIQRLQEEKDWVIVNQNLQITPSQLTKIFGENDDLTEFVLKRLDLISVVHLPDSVQIDIQVAEAETPSQAFGLYGQNKSPSLRFFDIGFESYWSNNLFVTWYGRYCIRLRAKSRWNIGKEKLIALAKILLKEIPEQKEGIPYLEALPKKHRVPYSEKYDRQHWLNQPYFRNIYYADYHTEEGYLRIFIINNGTTSAADSCFWKYFAFVKSMSDTINEKLEIGTDHFIFVDPLWGKTILAKKNQLIYGVLNARNMQWVEDRLKELLERLKKKRLVKAG
ncbi:MAG: hypothetical protein Kow0037_12270 [Calditrichia bacterium]